MHMYWQFEVALTPVSSFPERPVNNVAKMALRSAGRRTLGLLFRLPHDKLSAKSIQTTHLKAMLRKQWYRSNPLDRRAAIPLRFLSVVFFRGRASVGLGTWRFLVVNNVGQAGVLENT